MKNSFLSAALALVLAGCSTTAPSINEYTILPVYSSKEALSTPANLSLRITPTKSIASLASKDLYYLRNSAQIGTYLYSRWADTPASMIDRSLVSSLQNRRLFAALLPNGSNAHSDLILESDLHAFYHRIDADGTSEGFIDITYRLIEFKSKNMIASKRFIIISPSPSADARGGADALSVATRHLSQESILWLEMIAKENQWIK